MARPVIKVYLDFDRSGSFATEVTSYVIDASWMLGFDEPYGTMARDSTSTITLNNLDRRFTPEYASGAYYGSLTTGITVKITSTYASVTRTMFTGWLNSITPSSGLNNDRRCIFDCTGWVERATRSNSVIALQLEKTADAVIAEILGNSSQYPAGFAGFWLLGEATIGVKTKLGATSSYFIADVGQTTFAYSGDWASGTTVYSAISEMTEREAGKFFIARDGLLYFYDRHHLISNTTSLSSFSNATSSMRYGFGGEISNIITVPYEPRTTGSAGSTLATLTSAVEIAANSTELVTFVFTQAASGATVSATTVITPVSNTDYTANTLEDGSGVDKTAFVSVAVSETTAGQVILLFTNTFGGTVYLQPASKVRGTPLTSYGRQTYVAEDTTSVLAYGRYAMELTGKQDSLTDAQTLGDFQLLLRKDPRGQISDVLMNALDTTITASVLARTIGDRITLVDTLTSASGDWFIIREQHNVSVGNYEITWALEDAGASAYWSIGNSTLGVSTVLAPL